MQRSTQNPLLVNDLRAMCDNLDEKYEDDVFGTSLLGLPRSAIWITPPKKCYSILDIIHNMWHQRYSEGKLPGQLTNLYNKPYTKDEIKQLFNQANQAYPQGEINTIGTGLKAIVDYSDPQGMAKILAVLKKQFQEEKKQQQKFLDLLKWLEFKRIQDTIPPPDVIAQQKKDFVNWVLQNFSDSLKNQYPKVA